jgi:hypothetical protein
MTKKDQEQFLFQRQLHQYSLGVVYFNSERHSMMLFVVNPRLDQVRPSSRRYIQVQGQTVCADGGDDWFPDVQLAHEFSLLPHIERFDLQHTNSKVERMGVNNEEAEGENGEEGEESDEAESEEDEGKGIPHTTQQSADDDSSTYSSGSSESPTPTAKSSTLWGGVTAGCTSVLDMQNKMFQLGFGPCPYYRRSGVLVYLSPNEDYDDDPREYRLGCIVAHRHMINGCCHNPLEFLSFNDDSKAFSSTRPSAANVPEDLRCYFCQNNPFYEVLFDNNNPLACTVVKPCSSSRHPAAAAGAPGASAAAAADPADIVNWENNASSSSRKKSRKRCHDEDDDGDEDDDSDSEQEDKDPCCDWKTVPITATRACHRVVPVGSKLVIQLKDIKKVLPFFSLGHQTHLIHQIRMDLFMKRKRENPEKYRFKDSRSNKKKGQNTGSNQSQRSQQLQRPLMTNSVEPRTRQMMTHLQRQAMLQDMQSQHLASTTQSSSSRTKDLLKQLMEKRQLRCFMNVPSILCSRDGLVCVAVSCAKTGAHLAGNKMRNMYVPPQYLRMPHNDKQWDEALAYICV